MTTVQKPICNKANCSKGIRFARWASEIRWKAKESAQPRVRTSPRLIPLPLAGRSRENRPGAVISVIPTSATSAPR